MKDLKGKVQAMLDGEKKRREIALKWLEELTAILGPVANDIWGSGVTYGGDLKTWTADVTKVDKEGKKKETGIYFRYESHHDEFEGFYQNNDYINFSGTSINDLKGKDFWYAIQVIIDWIPQVMDAMEKRNISRNELLKKINITA